MYNTRWHTSSTHLNHVAYSPESAILTLLVWYKLAETEEVPSWEGDVSGTPKTDEVQDVVKSLTGARGNVDTTLLVAASKNGSDETFESVLNAIREKLSAQEASGGIVITIRNKDLLAFDLRSSVSFRFLPFSLVLFRLVLYRFV